MRFIEPVELHAMTPHARACVATVTVETYRLFDHMSEFTY